MFWGWGDPINFPRKAREKGPDCAMVSHLVRIAGGRRATKALFFMGLSGYCPGLGPQPLSALLETVGLGRVSSMERPRAQVGQECVG